jgi:hypothetical protein
MIPNLLQIVARDPYFIPLVNRSRFPAATQLPWSDDSGSKVLIAKNPYRIDWSYQQLARGMHKLARAM